jgi:tRNA threonylcarbamoyladenosine biosynthesis protein TsaE
MAEPAVSASAIVTEPALEAWGRGVGERAVSGGLALPLVIVLRGPLGAGKSVLARAIARGAGVESGMPSPTYNLLFSYAGGAGVRVHHLDLYRLEDPDDVWELGWDELGVGDQVVLIEWPERAETLLPPDRWDARLTFVEDQAGHPKAELRRLQVVQRGGAPEPPRPPTGNGGGRG